MLRNQTSNHPSSFFTCLFLPGSHGSLVFMSSSHCKLYLSLLLILLTTTLPYFSTSSLMFHIFFWWLDKFSFQWVWHHEGLLLVNFAIILPACYREHTNLFFKSLKVLKIIKCGRVLTPYSVLWKSVDQSAVTSWFNTWWQISVIQVCPAEPQITGPRLPVFLCRFCFSKQKNTQFVPGFV